MDTKLIPAPHKFILETLNTHGHEAYIVGGAVRDLLLGLTPKDFDITTSATPEQVAELFWDVELVGANFGVSLVPFMDGVTVEVATFRTDGAYSDGRRPDSVSYTLDVREDLQRRDFTVNALLLNQFGAVLDHVGGLGDLASKVIRAVGKPAERIMEDPVRMLRAVRIAAKLGFELDSDLTADIRAYRDELRRVAPERIAMELTGMLTSGAAHYAVKLLDHLWLLPNTVAEVEKLGVEQNPKYHPEGDVFTHTLGLLKQLPKGCDPVLAWAVLLHDIGKPGTLGWNMDETGVNQPTFHGHEELGAKMTTNILQRLKFSTEFTERVTSLVAQHMMFRNLPSMRKAKQLRFVRQADFNLLLHLHYLDATAGSGNLNNYCYALNLFCTTPEEVLRPATKVLTGHDLVKMGLKPGPLFKELLTAVEDQQLEGTVTNKADAKVFVFAYMLEKLEVK